MYQLRKLHSVHREVIRLRALGMIQEDIARELGVTQAFVGITLNSELGRIAMNDLQEKLDARTIDVGAALQENAKHAEDFLGRVVRGDGSIEGVSPALRARVCMDQLDRSGFGKITKNVTLDLGGALTTEEIMEIKRMGREMIPSAVVLDDTPGMAANG